MDRNRQMFPFRIEFLNRISPIRITFPRSFDINLDRGEQSNRFLCFSLSLSFFWYFFLSFWNDCVGNDNSPFFFFFWKLNSKIRRIVDYYGGYLDWLNKDWFVMGYSLSGLSKVYRKKIEKSLGRVVKSMDGFPPVETLYRTI